MNLRCAVAILVVAALMGATALFAHRLDRVSPLRWWMNVLIPGMQALFMALLLAVYIMFDVAVWHYALVAAAGVLCVVIDVNLLKALRTSEEHELAKERTRMLKQQLTLQRAHFEQLESDVSYACATQERIAAGLDTVRRVLFAGDGAAVVGAAELRAQLLGTMSPDLRTQVCEHPALDALLAAKRDMCEKQGIRLSLKTCVSAGLAVPAVDLCAIFSNAIDNAIAACVKVGAGSYLEVRAREDAGFLLLEVRNSCPADSVVPDEAVLSGGAFREHGWGISIVRRLVERYDGVFKMSCEQGEFCTTVALNVRT